MTYLDSALWMRICAVCLKWRWQDKFQAAGDTMDNLVDVLTLYTNLQREEIDEIRFDDYFVGLLKLHTVIVNNAPEENDGVLTRIISTGRLFTICRDYVREDCVDWQKVVRGRKFYLSANGLLVAQRWESEVSSLLDFSWRDYRLAHKTYKVLKKKGLLPKK